MATIDIEHLNRRRRWLLTAFVATYTLWQGTEIARRAVQPSGSLAVAMRGLSVLGALLWVAASVWLYRSGKLIAANPTVASALNDERVGVMRLRALAAGFVALIVYLVLLRLSKILFEVPVDLAAELGILVGVVVSVGSFVLYERRDP
jgi:hypothetical protein